MSSPEQPLLHIEMLRHAGLGGHLSLSSQKPGLGPCVCVQQTLPETLTQPKDGEQLFKMEKGWLLAYRLFMYGKDYKVS